jgi:ferredoxin-type protein NapH
MKATQSMWTTEITAIVLWLTILIGLTTAIILGIVIWTKKKSRRKAIRYLRWSVKAAFLLIFMIPIAYLLEAPAAPVYSYFYDGLNNSFLSMPLGQSPDVIWLFSFGVKASGARIVCPLWAVQTLVAGQVLIADLVSTVVAMLLFFILIIVLGNMFCGWVCPVGTMIDSFDRLVTKFLPKVDSKRVERSIRDKELRAKRQSQSSNIICPSCPIGRFAGRYGVVANGVIVSSFVGSAAFGFPVFCTICPIGISTRGVSHLSSTASITGKFLPIILELWAIPVVAVLASLRERRFWCKKICPVGALLNLAGAFNPFFKPVVNADKCRLKGCPKDCEDYRLDYCFMCRQMDQKECEKACPVDINLTDKESLSRCTKCFECYITCDRDAIEIKLSGMPDAIPALSRFFKRKRKRTYNPEILVVFNEINSKIGNKLIKLELDAQEFDLEHVTQNNISCFVVRHIERAKNLDRYYAVKITKERILAKNKMLKEEVEIPVSSVGYGLRGSSCIKTIDVTNREDFIILSKFGDANKVCPGITDETLKSWKQKVEERATNFLIARRFVLPAFDLSALAFYSDNPIVGADMWSIRGLSNEEAKLQTLWFNSTPNLLQIHMLQTLDTRMKIHGYKLREFNFLNTEKLSQMQRNELLNLFREIGTVELPSILTQLENKYPLRLRLDMAILKILGYGEAEASRILNQLYPLLAEEIKMRVSVR